MQSETTAETDCPDCGRLAHDGECEHPSAWFDRLTDGDVERFIQDGLEAVQKENAFWKTTVATPNQRARGNEICARCGTRGVICDHRKCPHPANGHFCPDWDFLLIKPGDPEMECCTCAK